MLIFDGIWGCFFPPLGSYRDWAHIMQFNNITGGLDSEPLLKIMYKGVVSANNSKLTTHLQNRLIFPQKEHDHYDPLPIVLWT